MYGYIKGTVAYIDNPVIILDNNGIGYNIIMGNGIDTVLEVGEEVKVFTYTSVREDAINLYGFMDHKSLDFFKKLINVSGIGPKVAIGMLSAASVEDLIMSIVSGDAKSISKLPGIGPKTAGRIILELKDKVDATEAFGQDSPVDNGHSSVRQEAIEALSALGITPSAAMKALAGVTVEDDMRAEDLVRIALMNL
ncbi:MAG: Holliday junction branch migration protein RuvA [Lachnospiraceae bacterium]|nr:Holliday junction branch migration protein RuvA [Lachnospiraceae bacterium]